MRTALALLLISSLATPALAQQAPDPRAQFEEQVLGFEDTVIFNAYNGNIINRYSDPVEGTYRRPLKWGEFYRRVGRSDLASKWSSRRATKIALIVGGVALVLGGFGAIAAGVVVNDASFKQCLDAHPGAYCPNTSDVGGYAAGGALLGAGFISTLVGIILPKQPAEPWETRQLADHYNHELANQLGISF
jgi:hypothetical protein